ncbi:hypothetical protein Egran_06995 [Elaphomyces granulatus]|uniref:Uncharacterized protein n=1 Tax=Elaphomyces granulatus TaxID=519963 RepID=A0A232LN43_9EURO|nr:hypothetical protein Egran_06995 [Elaphomyces granulatus]
MGGHRQTISVVDKSGKVVSISKHLVGVLKEARDAYRERKAEIQACRALTFDVSRSAASSSSKNQEKSRRDHHHRHSRLQSIQEEDFKYSHPSSRAPTELSRRRTAHDVFVKEPAPAVGRSNSLGHAYEELNGLVSKAKGLLVEADCVHRSATVTIAHLQKNPEAMAAVALTLAEISRLVSNMAPRVIASLRTSAPMIFSLLASPQFLIGAGVGIGVTVVMLGGYKIVKKITDADNPSGMDELVELESEHLTRIEAWRRGVADAEINSVGTSVEEEFITPAAVAMSSMTTPRSRGVRPQYLDTESPRSSRHSRRTSSKLYGEEEDKRTKDKGKTRSSRLR